MSVGDTIFRPGDVTYDLVLIDQGAIDIVTTPVGDAPEEILVQHHAGNILGELNLLTGSGYFSLHGCLKVAQFAGCLPHRFGG